MVSHSVTCQAVTRQRWHSRPHPSRSWYSIKRPRRDARLSWPSWLVTYRDGIPAGRRSLIQILTGPDVRYLFSFRNLVKPSEMPRPLALTGITAHTQNTLHQVTKHEKTRKPTKAANHYATPPTTVLKRLHYSFCVSGIVHRLTLYLFSRQYMPFVLAAHHLFSLTALPVSLRDMFGSSSFSCFILPISYTVTSHAVHLQH